MKPRRKRFRGYIEPPEEQQARIREDKKQKVHIVGISTGAGSAHPPHAHCPECLGAMGTHRTDCSLRVTDWPGWQGVRYGPNHHKREENPPEEPVQ